jgi:hypothetical protein
MKFNLGSKFVQIIAATSLLLAASLCASGQSFGRIKGTVREAAGVPISGVAIVATNQATGKWQRVRSNAEGVCEFQLPAGDYRLKPEAPYPRAEALKNVVVEPGKETVVDIPLGQVEVKEVRGQPGDKPIVNAVSEIVPPAPQISHAPQFIQAGLGPASGRIKGSVHMASGAPMSGIGIVATNQVTGKWKRVLTNAGVCEFQLPAGDYRLKPDAPYPRAEALKNVVVEPGKETVVDIPLEEPKVKEVVSQPDVRLVGNSVSEPVKETPVDIPIDRVKGVEAPSPRADEPIRNAVSEIVPSAPQTSQAGLGQGSGRIKGTVRVASGAPISGIEIVATNQVTGKWRRVRTNGEGVYVFQLPAGAYRLKLTAPHVAKFDKDKNYGDFTLPRGEALENVIVEPGKETVVDIPLDQVEVKEISPQPGDKPLGNAGSETVASEPQINQDRREARDRWRIGFPEYDRYGDRAARGRDIPFKKGRWWDPYNQSVLKGDYPIRGNNTFFILSGVSTTSVEQRRAPTPSDVSSDEPLSAEFFGQPEQFAANQTVQLSFELFHGDTTFKPRDWAIKISPTFSIPNYLNARENGVVNIDVRRGANRTDTHFSLEEAFAEVKLFDINSNYDFVSVRAGIQSFSSDFRGFIFSDNNLGFRVFGAADNNRVQFNAAYFSMLEKDTNSGLNTFDTRHQNVYVANVFRQDFIRKGYTIQASALYNDDRRSVEYDTNGFLVRPAFIGDVRPHAIKVGYIGINGDGHLGKLNLTNSYYYAFGRDDRNPIAGRSVSVRSSMAAVEASMDHDFLRFKGSIFFAQGDSNPTDDKATGFDAILDDPNFVGGQFSFWNRNGIRLTQTGVGLVQGNSLLPSLRSSKTQGQANFVNPGILIYNAGVDADVTQRIKAVFNVNYLRFHRTEPLEYVLFQNRIRHEIGWDYSLGVAYRPFLINNVTLTFGANTLQTGRGFRDIFTDRSRNCPPNVGDFCQPDVINPRKPLYSLFTQLKLIF